MSHGINDNTYRVLRNVRYHDSIRSFTDSLTVGELVGSVICSQIIIPEAESTIQEDQANSQLTDQEYIDLLVSKKFVEVVE